MTNGKLTILVDMDDTIEYLLRDWLAWLNDRHGTHVTEDDIHDYDLTKAFPGLTPDQVYAPLYFHDLWEHLTPVPGASKALEMLQEDGHEIYIVTSSNFSTIKTKIAYILHRYFPFIDDDHVIIARKKQMIRGDVLIDDAPHNLVGGEYLKIMPTAAHNRDFDAESAGIIRAENWAEIYETISEYAMFYASCDEAERMYYELAFMSHEE